MLRFSQVGWPHLLWRWESSGIFEKIFSYQFQFTKDTRYNNKEMEHMEHFYKDDSYIITHTIWVILSLNCFETFFVRFQVYTIKSLENVIFSMKHMIGMISSLLRQSCRWLEVFEVFECKLACNLCVVHFSCTYLAFSRDSQTIDCRMSSNRLLRLRSPKILF